MPEFKVADPVHDYRALETARKDAEQLLASKHFWKDPEYAILKSQLEQSGALEVWRGWIKRGEVIFNAVQLQ